MEVAKLRKKTHTELQEVLRDLEKEYQGVVTDILQNKEKGWQMKINKIFKGSYYEEAINNYAIY